MKVSRAFQLAHLPRTNPALAAPIVFNISGDGQLKYACTNADVQVDITGYIVRHPPANSSRIRLTLTQVLVKRARSGVAPCRTSDQLKTLQNLGARAMVVIDDLQERLNFVWCVTQPSSLSSALPLAHVSCRYEFFYSGFRPYIPTAMISASDGALLMSTLAASPATGALSNARENSLRINITNVVDCDTSRFVGPNCPAGSLFAEANVEFRLTANSSTPLPQWLSYGKLHLSRARTFYTHISLFPHQASTSPTASWTRPAETSRSTPSTGSFAPAASACAQPP